ncbi:MAG TPA: cupin domain-containing protein [Candidatus Limnocylindrales bacterium]|nr:cupin domain-containing protein [Candidatus Limnocylindrales bacterium]
MSFVTNVDWSFTASPAPPSERSAGLARRVLVGPEQGAVHTELAVGAFAPGGWLQRHVHSFEEAFYVLAGEILVELDGHVHHLVKGDYVLMPIGVWHALANAGPEQARFLSVNTPQRLAPDAGRKDTFFVRQPFDPEAFAARAARPALGSPTTRWVGHYDGTPPQAEALRLDDPARGRNPAGMDTALVVYSGISVKMLVDRVFGADLLTMFTVDYEPGGSAQAHDHPFEETYFFLSGETEAELDGETVTLRAGDVVFAGVGSVHGFYNTGTERVRWIETQAPQPPARHAYRWVPTWRRFEEENDVE